MRALDRCGGEEWGIRLAVGCSTWCVRDLFSGSVLWFDMHQDGSDTGREGDDKASWVAERDGGEPVTVGFVCVQNAGRSQMATAFAERERAARALEDVVTIVTGGTDPAAHVHDVVVDVMGAVGFDLGDRTPREVTFEEIQACDLVVTMGCSAEDVCPASWAGENRDWGLADPADATRPEAVAIRDEIEGRVMALFDELEADS